MLHATSFPTMTRLAAALFVAAGLLAGLGARQAMADTTTTTAYPVSVECAGTMQRCNQWFELSVFTSDVLRVRFVASPTHCSDIRVGIQRDRRAELHGALDVPPMMSSFLAHGAGTQEYVLDPPATYAGSQRILMTAEGRVGGCNTGRLLRYSGTLYVTTSEGTIDYGNCACPPAGAVPAPAPPMLPAARSLPESLRITPYCITCRP